MLREGNGSICAKRERKRWILIPLLLLFPPGVRLDRVRGGRQKYKRKIDSTSDVLAYQSAASGGGGAAQSKRMRGRKEL